MTTGRQHWVRLWLTCCLCYKVQRLYCHCGCRGDLKLFKTVHAVILFILRTFSDQSSFSLTVPLYQASSHPPKDFPGSTYKVRRLMFNFNIVSIFFMR